MVLAEKPFKEPPDCFSAGDDGFSDFCPEVENWLYHLLVGPFCGWQYGLLVEFPKQGANVSTEVFSEFPPGIVEGQPVE